MSQVNQMVWFVLTILPITPTATSNMDTAGNEISVKAWGWIDRLLAIIPDGVIPEGS